MQRRRLYRRAVPEPRAAVNAIGSPLPRLALLVGAGTGALLSSVVIAASVLLAPDVTATCERIWMLVERSGERIDDPEERELCIRELERRRESLGRLRWARLARCIASAESLSEAGGCRTR